MPEVTTPAEHIQAPANAQLEGVPKVDRKERLPHSFDVRILTPENEDEWHAYGLLRAKVYGNRGLIDEKDINENNEEFDDDDRRAVHIGVFTAENQLVGCSRLIEKFYDEYPLPVEDTFNLKAEPRSLEASRMIVDRDIVPAGTMQHEAAYLMLVRAMVYESQRQGNPYVYAIVEKSLKDHLGKTGMTVEQLSEETVRAYNTDNYAVRINVDNVIEDMAAVDRDGRKPELAGFMRVRARQRGLGKTSLSEFVVNAEQFERNAGFLNPEEQKSLMTKRVAIAGTGGDGGQLAIDLARMGVQEFALADPQEFGIENLNRQAGSNHLTVGDNKARTIAEEIYKINPYAKITLYEKGVGEDNVKEFVAGSDLVIDETEYTMPELGVMIARAAREEDIPVSMVLNVGHGARAINFHPNGDTLESWLDIDPSLSIEEIREMGKKPETSPPLEHWIGRLPSYANTDSFAAVASGEKTAPSLSSGVSIAAGVGAAQALNILLSEVSPARGKDVIWAPHMGINDGVESLQKINPRSKIGFAVSALRALIRTKQGKNSGYN